MLPGLYHRLYLLCLYIGAWSLRFLWVVKDKQNHRTSKSVLALPSYPENWPGAKERMADWKPFFEKDKIRYEVHWPCTSRKYLNVIGRPGTFAAFVFHLGILSNRVRKLIHSFDFDVVYIQREVIPLYDSRWPGFEKLLIKKHPGVVFDFYDSDYESTPIVTNAIFQNAQRITVASPHLQNYVAKFGAQVLFTRLSMPIPERRTTSSRAVIRIGWMGSPGNAINLVPLAPVFRELSRKFPHLEFSFVCRSPPDMDFDGIDWLDMNALNFNYQNWLDSIDLGIVPYLEPTERTKAKTAMKSLEFWANSIPMVCSPWGMSDQMRHGVNALVANELTDWIEAISKLVENSRLRNKLSLKGYETMVKFHSYKSNYQVLRDFLLQ